MYFDEVESDNMFFEVCIAVLLLYDSIGASQILKNVGRNVGERFRFKTIHSDNITLGNHIIISEPPPICHYLRTDKYVTGFYSSKSSNFVDKKLQMRNIIINFAASQYEKNGKYGDYKERRPKNYSAT